LYRARHYKVEGKKRFTWKAPLLGLFFISTFLFLFWNRKEILFYFSGNVLQKNFKLEKKIIEEYLSGKLKKETIAEFISSSSSLIQLNPTLPRASHVMAKGFFYNLVFSGFEFSLNQAYLIILEDQNTREHLQKYNQIVNGMYRNALRANIFQKSYPEKDSNQLLIALSRTLEARMNPSLVLADFIKIDYENLTPDLKKIYFWLGLILSTKAGNEEELEIILDKNNYSKEFSLTLTEREVNFLYGLANYHKKNYVKALEFLRKAKQDLDFLTIEATKLEAMIFYYQNLYEKAILLLEDLNKKLNYSNPSVIEKITLLQNLKAQTIQ